MKFVVAKEFVRPFVALALLAAALAGTGEAIAQTPPPRCTATGTNQTCQNSTTLTGSTGILDNATLTLTNTSTGTIAGTNEGVRGVDVNVTNSNTIEGTFAISTGILGNVSATVTNHSTGTITGGNSGIRAPSITVINEGKIKGGVDGILGSGSVTNSGTIESSSPPGSGHGSVVFTGGAGITNTLTLQTGSQLIGDAAGSTAGATNKLVLQGSGTADNDFLHFNSLDVSASGGAWFLNGNTEVGTVTLQTGTLFVNGRLTGNVTLNSTTQLAGSGIVTGDVTVLDKGRLAPGNSGGQLSVSGNVNFSSGSHYFINASPKSAASLAVGGTAALTGADVTVQAPAGTFAPSMKYTILTATGGFGTTRFDKVSTTAASAFLTPTLSYSADNTIVFLTLDLINTPGGGGGTGGSVGFASTAQTRNQIAVASALDAAPTSNSLVGKLLTLSADGARAAFDALSGEVFGSVHNTQAQESSFTRSGVLGRLRQASYSDAPGELGALGFAGPELAYADGHASANSGSAASSADGRLAYAADANGSVPVKAPRGGNYSAGRDLTFWAQGLGGWGHSDSDGNAASLKSRFGGFLSGADMRFGQVWRAGLVAGYTRSDLKADARASSAGIDSVTVGLYAGGRLGAFNLRTGASFSYDSIDTSRSVIFSGFSDATRAHFHGQVGQLFGEVGYGMGLGTFAIEPFAGLAYMHLNDGSFLESGGIAALSGSSAHEDIGYSSLGIRAATFVPLGNGTVLVPRASAQWQHAFGDVTPVTALAFQSTGTAFTVAGIPIARDSALVETGLDWRISTWTRLGAFYQGELAAHAQSHAIKGGFTLDF